MRLRELRVAAPRTAGGARRPAHRAPVRLPPRTALARGEGGRARGRLGRRAAAGPDADQRRPRLAPARRAQAAASCSTGFPSCYAVLGNHDLADTRDPFGRRSRTLELGPATLLADDSRTVEVRGRRVQIAGVDPRSYTFGMARPDELADPTADLRILLCHFPGVIDKLGRARSTSSSRGTCTPGQICVPFPADGSASRICAGSTSRACTSGPRGCSTCRPASARPSSRSASSPGRRRELEAGVLHNRRATL